MNYRLINNQRQFKDSTGHSQEQFNKLLLDFEKTYYEQQGQSYENYVLENVTEPPKLKTLGDCLFFVLFQLKNDLIFGSLGVVFNMSATTAYENFQRYCLLLEQTLEKKRNASP